LLGGNGGIGKTRSSRAELTARYSREGSISDLETVIIMNPYIQDLNPGVTKPTVSSLKPPLTSNLTLHLNPTITDGAPFRSRAQVKLSSPQTKETYSGIVNSLAVVKPSASRKSCIFDGWVGDSSSLATRWAQSSIIASFQDYLLQPLELTFKRTYKKQRYGKHYKKKATLDGTRGEDRGRKTGYTGHGLESGGEA